MAYFKTVRKLRTNFKPKVRHASVLINGQETDSLSVFNRGLHYSDGIFETIAVHQGQPLLWERHTKRLLESCKRLRLDWTDVTTLREEASYLLQDVDHAILKVILTRHWENRSYKAQSNQVDRILIRFNWHSHGDDIYHEGVNLFLCKTVLSHRPAVAGLKTLDRIEQVLASQEWDDQDIFDGVMCDSQGKVIECTSANLFMVKKNVIYTSAVEHCGVAGIVRQLVLDIAKQLEMKVKITAFDSSALFKADEVFITNSIFGIVPVAQIEANTFNVGPVYESLRKAIAKERYPIDA